MTIARQACWRPDCGSLVAAAPIPAISADFTNCLPAY
jgi:hypothetical protein